MNSKTLVSAALSVVAWTCAGAPTTASAGGPDSVPCANNKCDVSVNHYLPFADPDVPQYIDVNATSTDTVTVTWNLTSILGTNFDPKKGIEFADPKFVCQRVTVDSYSCTGTNLAPKTTYKYTITLHGFFANWPLDPFIRNN